MLQLGLNTDIIEAGCDEAGRGCLAGAVFAAAVILPTSFICDKLDDSKKVNEQTRYKLRTIIEEHAIAFAIGTASSQEIDQINILKASFLAMHRAIEKLSIVPEHLLIDGNRFIPYSNISHTCIVKGDAKFSPIAAASILAKTYRDDYMKKIDEEYPFYGWQQNKGYPTAAHREAIEKYGTSPYHRLSFNLKNKQLNNDF